MSTATLAAAETDQAALARLEEAIARNKDAFTDVALALLEIHGRKLWRDKYESFSDYCRRRWGIKFAYGKELVDAGRTVKNLTTAGLPLPSSARQARIIGTAYRKGRGQDQDDDRKIPDDAPGKAQLIETQIAGHLACLSELHAPHAAAGSANHTLSLLRELLLPWPPLAPGST